MGRAYLTEENQVDDAEDIHGADDDVYVEDTWDYEVEDDEAAGILSYQESGFWDEDDIAFCARKLFLEIKASRGFWPVYAIPPSGTPLAGPSSSTIPPTTSSPTTTKGKGKKGKSKSKNGKGGKSAYKNAPSRTQAAGYNLTCLKCGPAGHWASQCPLNSNKSSPSSSPTKKS